MKNRDRRIERYQNDARFNQLVSMIEHLFYSDNRVTYEEILDAAFVARIRFVEFNPSINLVMPPLELPHD